MSDATTVQINNADCDVSQCHPIRKWRKVMRILIPLLFVFAIAACGERTGTDAALASEGDNDKDSMCSCYTDVPTTGARAAACEAYMGSKTPEESANEMFACRAAMSVPEDGPDLCYCMRSSSTDPTIMAMCEEIIPDDWSPREIGRQLVACSQN